MYVFSCPDIGKATKKKLFRWNETLFDEYTLGCDVRQVGLTSPTLFNLYIKDLIEVLSSMHVRCYINGLSVNSSSYVDDMVLLSSLAEA